MKPIASSSRDTTSRSKPAAAKESEQYDLVDPEVTLSCVTDMPDFIYLLARFYNHCPDLRI
jgi:hypothetical protein